MNEVRVNYSSRTRYEIDNFEVNGDDKHAWVCTCFIELQGESLAILLELEDEVHRILWENSPNGATRLPKSNTQASEVAFFDDSEPEFERLEPDSEQDDTPTSQAELKMVYYKTRT
jgi:hypothetical protein